MTDTLNSARGEEDADDEEEEEGDEEGGDNDDDIGAKEKQKEKKEREKEKERERDRDSAVGFRLDDVRRSLEYECKEEEDVHHKNVWNLTDTAPEIPSTSQIEATVSERHVHTSFLQGCSFVNICFYDV